MAGYRAIRGSGAGRTVDDVFYAILMLITAPYVPADASTPILADGTWPARPLGLLLTKTFATLLTQARQLDAA
jgi:hypothetical protein